MDSAVELAWKRYLRSVERNACKTHHRMIRGTVIVDDDLGRGDNELLVVSLEDMTREQALPNKLPTKVVAEAVTFAFHPAKQDGPEQRYTFPAGATMTRRRKKPKPSFSVVGIEAGGRELWLTIERNDQGYVLVTKHFAGAGIGAEKDAAGGVSHVRGTRKKHAGHGHL